MSVVESQDILFNSNFETLYAYMSSALDAGDYKTAKLYASFCEISLPNIDRNHDIVQQFYAIQMIICIICDDCLGARMLWKRAPIQLKAASPPTDFSLLYQVIISIKDKNIIEAYKLLKATSWKPYIIQHTINARRAIQQRQLCTISKAFSTILLSTICELLDMSNEEVLKEISAYKWQVDEGTNSIKITTVIPDNDYQEQIFDETKMVLKLSSYIGHFEQKPIKVDLSALKN